MKPRPSGIIQVHNPVGPRFSTFFISFHLASVYFQVSAANGAEDFYSVEDHSARFEGLELARVRDRKAMEAWAEHPYRDIVDNRVDFEQKVHF